MHVVDRALIRERKLRAVQFARMVKDVERVLPKARRFVFDKAASAFTGRFIREFGSALLRNRQFAIPPFEQTYVEYDAQALSEALGRAKSSELLSEGAPDSRLGFLVDGNHVWTFVENSDGLAGIFPVEFWTDTTPTRGLFSNDLGYDKWRKLAYTLGTTLHEIEDWETMNDWYSNIDFGVPKDLEILLTRQDLAVGGNGTVRDYIAVLLMLNRQKDRVSLKQIPARGVIYKGKRRTYMAHSLVTIDVEDYHHIAQSYQRTHTRESPRRHQVRGFFRHLHRVHGCEHDYPLTPNENRWTCRRCGTVRVWVEAHERGDAGKGYRTKEYQVTDEEGQDA